jgi:predicted kinase
LIEALPGLPAPLLSTSFLPGIQIAEVTEAVNLSSEDTVLDLARGPGDTVWRSLPERAPSLLVSISTEAVLQAVVRGRVLLTCCEPVPPGDDRPPPRLLLGESPEAATPEVGMSTTTRESFPHMPLISGSRCRFRCRGWPRQWFRDPYRRRCHRCAGAGKTTLARGLSRQLDLPLLSLDLVKDALYPELPDVDRADLRRATGAVIWDLLADAPGGAVVDIWLEPRRDAGVLAAGLARAGVTTVVELLCQVPPAVAVSRYASRVRTAVHLPADQETLARIRNAAEIIALHELGPGRLVDTTRPVDIARLAVWVRTAAETAEASTPAE